MIEPQNSASAAATDAEKPPNGEEAAAAAAAAAEAAAAEAAAAAAAAAAQNAGAEGVAQELMIEVSALDALTADAERARKRTKLTKRRMTEHIDKMLESLTRAQKQLDQDTMEEEHAHVHKTILNLDSQFKELKPLKNIMTMHQETFAYMSKFGKNIDKEFKRDINNVFDSVDFDRQHIYNAIAEHLVREGQVDAVEALKKDVGVTFNEQVLTYFSKITTIMKDIKQRNLQPAIAWAVEESQRLEQIGSKLLFNMHKQQFIKILLEKGREDAINYAKVYFLQFCTLHQLEIQRLMTSLLFQNDPKNSPYADLFQESNWDDLTAAFIEDSCRLYQIPAKSQLYLAVTAGTLSLPQFVKLRAIMGDSEEWEDKQEIPIVGEIGKDFKFHSIFVCPVSREIMSPGEAQPMLLACGHVMSHSSLTKMTINETRPKFRCPTCQTPQKLSDVKRIYF